MSIGTILGVPGIRDALRRRPGAGRRAVADHRRRPGARHGRRLPAGDRRRGQRRGRRRGTTAPARAGGLLDGWLVHDTDTADVPGVAGARGAAADDRATTPPRPWCAPRWSWSDERPARPRRRRRIEILPVTGIGELRPGDDLAALIAAHAPRLARRRRPRRHVEGRVQGRGPAARARLRRPGRARGGPAGRDRRRDGAGRRPARRRCASSRPGTGWCWPRPAWTPPTSPATRLALLPRRPRRLGRSAARRAARAARRRRRRSSSPTRWAGPGGRAHRRRDRRRRAHRGHRPARRSVDGYGNVLERHRGRGGRRDRRGRRPGQGQAGRHPGRGRARARAGRQAARRRPRQPRAASAAPTTTCSAWAPPRRSPSGASRRRTGRRAPPPALHADAVATLTRRCPATAGRGGRAAGFLGFLAARPDAMWRSCVPGHLTASALVVDPSRARGAADPAPAGRHVAAARRALRDRATARVLDAAAREAREESGIGSLSFDPAPLGARRAPDHLLARRADPALRRAVPRPSPRPAPSRCSATSRSTCAGSAWDDLPDGVVARPAAPGRAARPRRRRAGDAPPSTPRSASSTAGRCRTPRRPSSGPAGVLATHGAARPTVPAGVGHQAAGRAGRAGRGRGGGASALDDPRRRAAAARARRCGTCWRTPRGWPRSGGCARSAPGHPAGLLQRRLRAGRRAGRRRPPACRSRDYLDRGGARARWG